MLNKINNLNENGSQLELIAKKGKNNMTNKTKPTHIEIAFAKDIFIIAKQFEKKNQFITNFTLKDDSFKLQKRDNCNGTTLIGMASWIVDISTEEVTEGKTIRRVYKRVNHDFKLSNENISYST